MNLKKQKGLARKGFTIIELIVVIAIIAILATIVISTVSSYVKKAKLVAIKIMSNDLIKAASSRIDSTGSFSGFCASSEVQTALTAIGKNSGCDGCYGCADLGSIACFCARENPYSESSPLTYCIDSSGYKKETNGYCSNRCSSGFCTDN